MLEKRAWVMKERRKGAQVSLERLNSRPEYPIQILSLTNVILLSAFSCFVRNASVKLKGALPVTVLDAGTRDLLPFWAPRILAGPEACTVISIRRRIVTHLGSSYPGEPRGIYCRWHPT